MSYENEDQGNEFANGNNNRFEGLDLLYKRGGYPRTCNEATHAARLEVVKYFGGGGDEVNPEDLTTIEIIREMHAARQAMDAANAITKELNKRYDYLRLALVPERFEAEGIKLLKVEGVGRVGLRGEMYAGIVPGQKEAAFEWLDDNGRGDLVQRTINASSLKASLKKMLQDGEEIPETLFKVTPFTMATITKG